MMTAKSVDRPVIMRVSRIAGPNFWVSAGLSSHVGSPLPVDWSACAAVAAARYAVVIGSSLPREPCSYAAAR